MEAGFDVEKIRMHLINGLENKFLKPFPKVWSHLSVQGAAIEKYSIRRLGGCFCDKFATNIVTITEKYHVVL